MVEHFAYFIAFISKLSRCICEFDHICFRFAVSELVLNRISAFFIENSGVGIVKVNEIVKQSFRFVSTASNSAHSRFDFCEHLSYSICLCLVILPVFMSVYDYLVHLLGSLRFVLFSGKQRLLSGKILLLLFGERKQNVLNVNVIGIRSVQYRISTGYRRVVSGRILIFGHLSFNNRIVLCQDILFGNGNAAFDIILQNCHLLTINQTVADKFFAKQSLSYSPICFACARYFRQTPKYIDLVFDGFLFLVSYSDKRC